MDVPIGQQTRRACLRNCGGAMLCYTASKAESPVMGGETDERTTEHMTCMERVDVRMTIPIGWPAKGEWSSTWSAPHVRTHARQELGAMAGAYEFMLICENDSMDGRRDVA